MLQQIVKKDAIIDRLSRASQMLVEATTIGDFRVIVDMAAAVKIYAERKKLGQEAIRYASVIELRALRKLGELYAKMPKNNGGRPKKTCSTVEQVLIAPPTLTQLGIDRKESMRAQSIAALSQADIERIENQDVSLNEVLKQIKKNKRKADIDQQKENIKTGHVKMPTGVFEVVVMDPPWNYGREYDPDGSRIANPYPEMPQCDLLKLSPPFANDCALFLWTTHAFIWDAKELMDSWGFQYKATLVWDKEKIGMGAWLRMQCEFCLVGIRGKPSWNNTTWRDIIREPRRQHSRKPDAFYKLVEEVTVGRRLDFFSREQRSGWASFGNDEHKFSN